MIKDKEKEMMEEEADVMSDEWYEEKKADIKHDVMEHSNHKGEEE